MYRDDAKYLKRKTKTGSIDVHPTERALVVHYELEATILGEEGDAVLGDRKACEKVIRLRNLDSTTDVSSLAKQVVASCSLIHPGKLPEIEQLIYYLQNRKDAGGKSSAPAQKSSSDALRDTMQSAQFASTIVDETASINNMEDYLELLYEDTPSKIRGAALILQLARNPDNLEELFNNETLNGALARVLTEDWRKSVDLSINIVYVFFCYSCFTQFHDVILHFRIGAQVLTIVEHELNKYDALREELDKRKKSSDFDKAKQKFDGIVKRQEQLLRVGYYLLLNISEDVSIEKKMKNRNIVQLLIRTLERQHNKELLLLVVSFLKKLSIFIENMDEIKRSNIIEKLAKLLPCDNEDLTSLILRLMLNLSFTKEMRLRMVKAGCVSKLLQVLRNFEQQRPLVLCVLYHISIDDRAKAAFAKTDFVPVLMKLILNSGEPQVEQEVIALGINLALDSRIASLICGGGRGLQVLLKRAFKSKDSLLMKMIRNIATQTDNEIKMQFVQHMEDLGQVVFGNAGNFDADFQIECLGILAMLELGELDYSAFTEAFDLINWFRRKLAPGACEDDYLLEAVMLLGTVCTDEQVAQQVCEANMVQTLIEALNLKQEDDEIVLQIVYVFYQLVFHKATRKLVIRETNAPAYLIDLMHDKNAEIRKLCATTLDIIGEQDDDWAKRIKLEKFRWHNSQWLDMVEGPQTSAGGAKTSMAAANAARETSAYGSSMTRTASQYYPAQQRPGARGLDESGEFEDDEAFRNYMLNQARMYDADAALQNDDDVDAESDEVDSHSQGSAADYAAYHDRRDEMMMPGPPPRRPPARGGFYDEEAARGRTRLNDDHENDDEDLRSPRSLTSSLTSRAKFRHN